MLWPYDSPNVRQAAKLPPAMIFGTLREKYQSEAYQVPQDARRNMGESDAQDRGLEGQALAQLIQAAVVLAIRSDPSQGEMHTDTESNSDDAQGDLTGSYQEERSPSSYADTDNEPDRKDICGAERSPLPGHYHHHESSSSKAGRLPLHVRSISGNSSGALSPTKQGTPARQAQAERGLFVSSLSEEVARTRTTITKDGPIIEASRNLRFPVPPTQLKSELSDRRRRLHKDPVLVAANKSMLGQAGREPLILKPDCRPPNASFHISQEDACEGALLYGLPVEEVVARLEWLRVQNGGYEQRGKLYFYKCSLSLSWERSVKGGPRYVMRTVLRRLLRLQPTMLKADRGIKHHLAGSLAT